MHVIATTHTDDPDDLDDAIEYARSRIDDLERRWSRFLPDSEVSLLNASAGRGPFALTAITFDVVARAVDEWRRSGGVFDPTILDALIAAGYDRSFADLVRDAAPTRAPHRAPGCDGIVVDAASMTVDLPAGTSLDLGGIGKGRAADLVAEELRDVVAGGCVNVGGDLRLWGTSPAGDDLWTANIEHDPSSLVMLHEGAIATSTITKRTWRSVDGRVAHHLIDPRTGLPSDSDVSSVTVIACDATSAEVVAKVTLISGNPAAASLPALLMNRDGGQLMVNGFEHYCRRDERRPFRGSSCASGVRTRNRLVGE